MDTEKKFRIRVEQRPNEGHKRYFPEVESEGRWRNTQMPIEARWYHTKEEAEKHIKRLIEFDIDYTESIIEYKK